MKKVLASAVVCSLFFSGAALATGPVRLDAVLADGYNDIAPLARQINLAQTGTLTAIPNRAGFVKQNFDFTVSANVALGMSDDATNNRLGVVAGSNKGYNVFTGSSVGGSVSSCGDQVLKTIANLAASEVAEDALDFDAANGCGR
jgi:hypothetical protein